MMATTMMYPLPPETKGDSESQLISLRNYLVRLTQQLNTAAAAQITDSSADTKVVATPQTKTSVARELADEDTDIQTVVRRNAKVLRDLIQKTSDTIYSYVDQVTTQLSSVYVAKSEFGTYKETVNSTFTATAKSISENFDYIEEVEGLVTEIQGQILRGIITYNGTTYFGIAIGQNLQVSGTSTIAGVTYNVITAGQNFALYTSEGWWFFLNGAPAGWYDSRDGKLHVENVIVENTMIIGNYQISSVGRWGIRYIGE